MLTRYAERRGFSTEQLSASHNEGGGFKEVTFAVKGDGAYSVFKWEGGTHRVQRVPETESQGRIHTSTATVAVMPEAEEVEVEIDPNDLKIDVYRSTGPGGQSVNTTDSAVRITHLPTGVVVAMQDEKSQLQNKTKALRVLRARLYELEREKQRAEQSEARRSQIGGGRRAEKIRTYNFPENRVTDHRVKLTAHRLDAVLGGELDEFTEALGRRGAAPRASSRRVTVEQALDARRGARARARGCRRAARRRRAAAARARARVTRTSAHPTTGALEPERRPDGVPRARRAARARARAARVRPRRVGLPAADAVDRPPRADPAAGDGDRRRALPRAAAADGSRRRACSTSAPAPARSRWRSRTSGPTRGWSRPTSRRTRSSVARENARARRPRRRASCRATCSPAAEGPFDLVVSNPPYVAAGRARRARAGGARLRAARGARRRRAATRRSPARRARRAFPAARSCSRSATARRPTSPRCWRGLGYADVAITPDLAGSERVVEGRRAVTDARRGRGDPGRQAGRPPDRHRLRARRDAYDEEAVRRLYRAQGTRGREPADRAARRATSTCCSSACPSCAAAPA